MTAKEMFMNLDYKVVIENEEEIIYQCTYNEDLDIQFLKKYKVVGGTPTYDYFCNMPLLKAINKQVEELGWLE